MSEVNELNQWFPDLAFGFPDPIGFSSNWFNCTLFSWGCPCSLVIKNLPAVQETQERLVQSLNWEDPLEEGMATHSSILAWRIPWTEETGGLQSITLRVGHD